MSKKNIYLAVAAVIVVAAAVLYFLYTKKNASPKVNLSAIETVGGNPLQKAPDLNPVDKTNPFRNIKTNPFQ